MKSINKSPIAAKIRLAKKEAGDLYLQACKTGSIEDFQAHIAAKNYANSLLKSLNSIHDFTVLKKLHESGEWCPRGGTSACATCKQKCLAL